MSVLRRLPPSPRAAVRKVAGRLEWARFRRALDVEEREDLRWLGNAYGGYVVPMTLVGADSVCYSCGVGEDASFDLALIEAAGCDVYAFDPTPRAQVYAEALAREEPRFHFMPYGLWSADERQRFYSPEIAEHASHSIGNLQHTSTYFDAECKTLESLMRELGHTRIDLLKLDIEGAEYEVLQSVLDGRVAPAVVCVEFHNIDSTAATVAYARRMADRGYSVVHVRELVTTFVARDAG